VALGLLGGIGIVIMTFVFGFAPSKPPVDVMLTNIAVVAASATLQAFGGLEVLSVGLKKCCAAIRNACASWLPSSLAC
jgi:anaerobic C4-dicarboxylate transporter DcuB